MKEFQEVRTSIDSNHSWWSGYGGMSIGRVIHYLYNYLSYDYAERSTIGTKDGITTVECYGKPVATIDWSNGFPLFFFTENLSEDFRYIANKRQAEALAATILDLSNKTTKDNT